jgi:signal transduction histidine kinase
MERCQDSISLTQVFSVEVQKISLNNHNLLVVTIKELTDACQLALKKLQINYQKLLTNAVSHERLTPINSIIGLTEVLIRQCSRGKDSSVFNRKNEHSSSNSIS